MFLNYKTVQHIHIFDIFMHKKRAIYINLTLKYINIFQQDVYLAS